MPSSGVSEDSNSVLTYIEQINISLKKKPLCMCVHVSVYVGGCARVCVYSVHAPVCVDVVREPFPGS